MRGTIPCRDGAGTVHPADDPLRDRPPSVAVHQKEKTRGQVIWLYAQQTRENRPSTLAVSQATGFSQNWVYKLIQRYNGEGPEGLIDKHRYNPGGDKRALLNQEEQQALSTGGVDGRHVTPWRGVGPLGGGAHRQDYG